MMLRAERNVPARGSLASDRAGQSVAPARSTHEHVPHYAAASLFANHVLESLRHEQ